MSDAPIPRIGADVAETVEMSALRRERDRVETQLRMASKLRKLAEHLERGEVVANPDRFAIVFTGDHGAAVSWGGSIDTWDEACDMAQVLEAGVWAGRFGQDVQEAANRRHDARRRSRAYAVELEAKAMEEKPWGCEFCTKRYKTKRGAETHEDRHCRLNPRSAFFAPRGEYVPRLRNGKVAGFVHISIAEQVAEQEAEQNAPTTEAVPPSP